ncbi:hypothetical protein [Streptomyces sp. SD31]|uniref:hypothetical protein n=1 Tax=Streptomyces sp. SD31 TaxID=3452208 RepID=UPI003F8CC6D7
MFPGPTSRFLFERRSVTDPGACLWHRRRGSPVVFTSSHLPRVGRTPESVDEVSAAPSQAAGTSVTIDFATVGGARYQQW